MAPWLMIAEVQAQEFTYATTNGTITLTGYSGPGGSVIIPSTINGLPVTEIGFNTFYGDTNMISVTIPNSVTSIGSDAFGLCTSLTNVTIPNSVIRIGGSAFSECYSLTSVTIPNSVTSFGVGVFSSCTSLTSANIPNSITSIDSTFAGCWSLTNVTIPSSVKIIGVTAFTDCSNLTSVTIPDSVISIDDYAFDGCTSLTSITIPSSVTGIGEAAFPYCTSLTSVYFQGNAPVNDGLFVFASDNATAYYLPGTLGWGSTFAGLPTALWHLPYPVILNRSPSFAVQTNNFGFTVSWATNTFVVVEACADLSKPKWSPVTTNALSGGTFYFSDPQWTNYPSRFYRIRSP